MNYFTFETLIVNIHWIHIRFISGPVMIIIFNHVIDKWVREMVSVGVEHFIMFIGHVVFLVNKLHTFIQQMKVILKNILYFN